MPTYTHPQATVPLDDNGEMIDCGRWRELGITHWHLSHEEWRMSDSSRFSNDDGAVAARRRATDGVARSPQEVASWHVAIRRELIEQYKLGEVALKSSGLVTPEDWRSREETGFFMAMHGKDVYGSVAVSEGRIVHLNASAMKTSTCHTA